MIFDRNESKEVIALLGAGSMGTAIARRISAGRKILLGDISEKNLEQVSHDCMTDEFAYAGLSRHVKFIRHSDLSDGLACLDEVIRKA